MTPDASPDSIPAPAKKRAAAKKKPKTIEATPEAAVAVKSPAEVAEPKPKPRPRARKASAGSAPVEEPEVIVPAIQEPPADDPDLDDPEEDEPTAPDPAEKEPPADEPEVKEPPAEDPGIPESAAKTAPAKDSARTVARKKAAAKAAKPAKVKAEPAPVVEHGKTERLQKILARAGISSRRKAEELILGGHVQVNGQVVTELGTKADPARDHVRVDGKLLQGAERIRYFVLNKPKGFVTTVSDPEGRPTVMQFFDREPERLYPVGRLDYLSEGLLLVTNDGELANKLTKASSGVEKTYLVKVAGQPTEDMLDALRKGVVIEKGRPGTGSGRVRTAPAQIRQVRQGDNPWYEVIIIEGRNRELRKMFEEIGHHVEKIRRVGYGPLILDLEPGKMRELEAEEVQQLRLAAEGKLKTRRRRGPAPAQLPKEAGKTVRFKKADGRPGYEKANYSKPEAARPSFSKPDFRRPARAPEPPVTEYVLPPRKSRPELEEDEKPAFNPDYKPGFRTGGKPAGKTFGAAPGGAPKRFGTGRLGQARPTASPNARPAAGRGGFAQNKPFPSESARPAAKDSGGERRPPFRPAPAEQSFPPAEPSKPSRLGIEPIVERPRNARPTPGGKPFSRPARPAGSDGASKPFRAYPGGPPIGDRSAPSRTNRPAGGKPFRPPVDGPSGGERPFRAKPAGDFEARPGRPPTRPSSRPTIPSTGVPGRFGSSAKSFRPRTDRPAAGGNKPIRAGGAYGARGDRPAGSRPERSGAGDFRAARSSRPSRPSVPARFAPRADAPPARRPKPFDGGGDGPKQFRPRPARRFDAPGPAPGGRNSKPSGKLGPDGLPRVKERARNSFTGKNKGRPKPKPKTEE